MLQPGARIAVVGAGMSGIVSARMLSDAGFDVTVFERSADVGGVWSAARAYPGISTQDDRRSYAFSDFPLPDDVAEHPTGAQVRGWLESYLAAHGLTGRVRLSTQVLSADLVDDREWRLEAEGPQGRTSERFDWLVAANGVFSTPHVPAWAGRDEFERAGGAVASPAGLPGIQGRVVVVGWGKTACDLAVAALPTAASVDVVARTLTWKYPKSLGALGLTFHHLVLTRGGERLVGRPYRTPDGRVILSRIPERVPRKLLGRFLARAIDRGSDLTALGLRPAFDVAASSSLVTDGFFEAVAEGRIRVHRETSVERLDGGDGPGVVLSSGERLPADLVLAATGYEQSVAFLSEAVLQRARTEDGDLLLYRRVLSPTVPRLAFAGWAHSYHSPVTAEIAAAWLAAVLTGQVELPSPAVQRQRATPFLLTHRRASSSRREQVPGVWIADLDEQLADMRVALPLRVRLRQHVRALDPADYAAPLARAVGMRPRRERVPEPAAPPSIPVG